MRFLELRNCTTCGVKEVQRAWVLQIGFSTNLSRLQQGPFSQKQKDFIAVTSKKEDKLYCKIDFVVSIFKKKSEKIVKIGEIISLTPSFHIFMVFENHRKSLIQRYERSELRLHFEWTKVN